MDGISLFLKNLAQIPKALKVISFFSKALGLYLNLNKCELMAIHGHPLSACFHACYSRKFHFWTICVSQLNPRILPLLFWKEERRRGFYVNNEQYFLLHILCDKKHTQAWTVEWRHREGFAILALNGTFCFVLLKWLQSFINQNESFLIKIFMDFGGIEVWFWDL